MSFWTGSLSKSIKTCDERSTFVIPIIFFLNCYFHDFSVKHSGSNHKSGSESSKTKEARLILRSGYSSFSRDVTTNYAMARTPEVGHAGGHSAGRVVSKQRPFMGQLLRGFF